MNLNYRRKRRVAWVITLAVILLAILLLGGWKLGAKRDDVKDYFFNGDDGFSIANDIAAQIECGYNLITIADRIKVGDAEAKELKNALTDAELAMTVEEFYDAERDMTNAVDALYAALKAAKPDEKELRLIEKQYDEFKSRVDTINRNDYNEKALSFNEERGAFPANLIAMLSGVRKLSLFRNGG